MGRDKASKSCDELELLLGCWDSWQTFSHPWRRRFFVVESSGGTPIPTTNSEGSDLLLLGNPIEWQCWKPLWKVKQCLLLLPVVSAVSTRHRTDVKLVDLRFFFYCLPVWSARAPAPFSYVLEKWIGLVLKIAMESALRNIEVEKIRVTNNNKIDCCSKM